LQAVFKAQLRLDTLSIQVSVHQFLQ
jgi:hypothetical protein